MMRALILTTFLLMHVRMDLFSSFKVTGNDGWNAVFETSDPAALKKPLIVLIMKNSETNTFFFLDDREQYRMSLAVEDGLYVYVVQDADRKIIEKGGFELRTPFTAAFRRIAPDYVELEIRPDGRRELKYSLETGNRRVTEGVTNIAVPCRFKLDRLEPSSAYTLTIGSGVYLKRTAFTTGPENVALMKPVFGTFNRLPVSRYVDDSTPAMTRVNDGKWDWMGGMAASGEVDSDEQFVYINLEKVRRLRAVTVVWHADHYPLSCFFVYGKDGRSWDLIRRDATNFTGRTAPDNTPVWIDEIRTNVEAGTIGIIIRKGEKISTRIAERNYVELLEIEAYE